MAWRPHGGHACGMSAAHEACCCPPPPPPPTPAHAHARAVLQGVALVLGTSLQITPANCIPQLSRRKGGCCWAGAWAALHCAVLRWPSREQPAVRLAPWLPTVCSLRHCVTGAHRRPHARAVSPLRGGLKAECIRTFDCCDMHCRTPISPRVFCVPRGRALTCLALALQAARW